MFLQISTILLVAQIGTPQSAPDRDCAKLESPARVVACAERAAPSIEAARHRLAATTGRHAAARVLLPSNPTISVQVAHRMDPTGRGAVNVYGTVSQEIEIAGQRRKRMALAKAERARESNDLAHTKRDVAAEALLIYYDVLAARETIAMLDRTVSVSERLREVAASRAAAGLAAPIDVDLAAAEVAKLRRRRAQVERALLEGQADLAIRVGLAPPGDRLEVRGQLRPILTGDLDVDRLVAHAAKDHPTVARARAQRDADLRRVDLLRRMRAPNPQLSFFAQSDGFQERVLGAGIALPIPLPAPLGRTNKGEIQEARARVRESDSEVEQRLREIRRAVTVAISDMRTLRSAAAAFDDPVLDRTDETLRNLAGEIEAGRLPVRDALITQSALLDVLLQKITARHAVALASVRLAHAAALPLDGGLR